MFINTDKFIVFYNTQIKELNFVKQTTIFLFYASIVTYSLIMLQMLSNIVFQITENVLKMYICMEVLQIKMLNLGLNLHIFNKFS